MAKVFFSIMESVDIAEEGNHYITSLTTVISGILLPNPKRLHYTSNYEDSRDHIKAFEQDIEKYRSMVTLFSLLFLQEPNQRLGKSNTCSIPQISLVNSGVLNLFAYAQKSFCVDIKEER